MANKQYIEHGTDGERINSWQRILILLDKNLSPAKLTAHLQKHYKINADWDDVFAFWKNTTFAHWTDKMFEADKKFTISVNKCRCKGQIQDEGNLATGRYYDINGMCKKCGLKLKK